MAQEIPDGDFVTVRLTARKPPSREVTQRPVSSRPSLPSSTSFNHAPGGHGFAHPGHLIECSICLHGRLRFGIRDTNAMLRGNPAGVHQHKDRTANPSIGGRIPEPLHQMLLDRCRIAPWDRGPREPQDLGEHDSHHRQRPQRGQSHRGHDVATLSLGRSIDWASGFKRNRISAEETMRAAHPPRLAVSRLRFTGKVTSGACGGLMRKPLAGAVFLWWIVCGVGPAAAQPAMPQVFAGAPAAPWIFPPGAAGSEFGVFHFRRVFELERQAVEFRRPRVGRQPLPAVRERRTGVLGAAAFRPDALALRDGGPGARTFERAAMSSRRSCGTGGPRSPSRSSVARPRSCCRETARARRS